MLSLVGPKSEWDKPALLYTFLSSPVAFAATRIYHTSLGLRRLPAPPDNPITVVSLSDTHTQIPEMVPEGDVLIHAGDMCNVGNIEELQTQIDWLRSLPHKYKVVIAGNHDAILDPRSRQLLPMGQKAGNIDWGDLLYLQHGDVVLSFSDKGDRQLKVYGAPQVPIDGPEHAFRYDREQDAWTETVPADVDILITHTPPRFHHDLPSGLGCIYLLKEVWRVKPKLHIFGHIHADPGLERVYWDDCQRTYERIRVRCTKAWCGGVFNPLNMLDMTVLCFTSLSSLASSLVWRGDDRCSMMVNAALMSQETGKLVRKPRVVMI
jgi:predicted phosphohydrolase